MKKILVLISIICMFGVLSPASADTMNYKIRYDGDSMVIVPYYSMPAAPEIQRTIPTIETAPVKIPYYSNKKLPKGKNRTRTV